MTGEASVDVRQAGPDDELAVLALLEGEDLEAAFAADEFLVAEEDDAVLGCARLKPLPEGAAELASVAVAPDRRGEGIGSRLVRHALQRAEGPVEALALQPAFFERFGFAPTDEPHPRLEAKARTCCRDRDETAMAWRPGE